MMNWGLGPLRWIWEKLWRGEVVSGGSLLLYGLGAGAMYGNDYFIAAAFYFVALAWLTAKVVLWEETKRHEQRRVIRIMIIVLGIGFFGGSLLWIAHQRSIHRAELARSEPKPAPKAADKEIVEQHETKDTVEPEVSRRRLDRQGPQQQREDVRLPQIPAIEVSLNCSYGGVLPLRVPPYTIGYIYHLNEPRNKATHRSYFVEVDNTEEGSVKSWPDDARLPPATRPISYRKCVAMNHGQTNLLNVRFPFSVIYGVIGPQSETVPYPIVINPLDKGQAFTFFMFNECPNGAYVIVPRDGEAQIVGEQSKREFHIELPDPDVSLRFQFSGSQTNITGNACD